MSGTPDYATWLTKQAAADAIRVTTKSIERFVQAGQIQQARWQREGRGPALAVYHPDDVARMTAERRQGPLPAFVVPVGAPPPNGNGHHAGNIASKQETMLAKPDVDRLASVQPGEDLLRGFMGAILKAVSETSQTSAAAYVPKADALAITGISGHELWKAVQAGEVKVRGRGYRRKDLEAL